MRSKETLPNDRATATLVPTLDDAVVLRAAYRRQRFALHSHPTYVLALITDGALKFQCGHRTLVAPVGSVCLINPNQVQTGEAASEAGWSYWSAYVPASVFGPADAPVGRASGLPLFKHHVVADQRVSHALGRFFSIAQARKPGLSQAESLLACLSTIVEEACLGEAPTMDVDHPRLVRSAKEWLSERFGEAVQLDDLARTFGVTGFHLTRAFKSSTGLALHAWLVQYRVERARGMLLKGAPLAETALACGFSDQPHMTRWFRRILGLTPGEARAMSRTFKTSVGSSR